MDLDAMQDARSVKAQLDSPRDGINEPHRVDGREDRSRIEGCHSAGVGSGFRRRFTGTRRGGDAAGENADEATAG